MRRQVTAGLLVLSTLFLTVHCGGDDDSSVWEDTGAAGGSGGSTSSTSGTTTSGGAAGADGEHDDLVRCPANIEDFPARVAAAICVKRSECCTDDTDACLTEVTAALENIYPELAQADAAGTAHRNCGAFFSCTSAILDASCDEWPLQAGSLGGLPVDQIVCRAMISPDILLGGPCNYSYECSLGFCRVPEGETVGTCESFADLNDSCDEACNPETMFCNAANLCQERLPNGASCTKPEECESRVCDVGGSDECVAPGPDECKYVPNGAPHCALARPPGSRHTPYGSLVLMVAAGLVVSVARRRNLR